MSASLNEVVIKRVNSSDDILLPSREPIMVLPLVAPKSIYEVILFSMICLSLY